MFRGIDRGTRDHRHGVQPPIASNLSPCASREQTNENGAGRWVDHGEKQRLMALAAGRMDGGGLEPSAGSDVSSCAKRMSNPGVEMPEGRFEPPRVYTQRISNPQRIRQKTFIVIAYGIMNRLWCSDGAIVKICFITNRCPSLGFKQTIRTP